MNKLLKTATITASALAIGLAFAASAVAAPKNHGGQKSAVLRRLPAWCCTFQAKCSENA